MRKGEPSRVLIYSFFENLQKYAQNGRKRGSVKRHPYQTSPDQKRTNFPPGIPYIVGNETAERFSFYGMKTILIVFMTKYLMDNTGHLAVMGDTEATAYGHLFNSAVYFLPIFGALLADAFLGKYKTIIGLSLVYCLGHLAMAMDHTRLGLSVGLTLIAIGSGGIKPCVSAHVGDQFGKGNEDLLDKVYNWFYFAINLGAGISTLATPWLLDNVGPHWAFGMPGILMFLATVVFWMGRRKFVHIPAGGMSFVRELFSKEGLGTILKLGILYAFVAMFWALYDQTGTMWVLQAGKMDLNFLGVEWLSSQIQAVNPFLILFFIFLFNGVEPLKWVGLYALINKAFELTPLRKLAIGFFITVPAFMLPAWIETQIAVGEFPSIGWQLVSYVILTVAEVFVSITCLEFSYTQAPRKMKSLVLAAYLMSISLGNLFTAGVNFFIQNPTPSFKPDVAGQYEMELAASDGKSVSSSFVTINVVNKETPPKTPEDEPKTPKAEPPNANAGHMVAVTPGKLVRMYGSAKKGDVRIGFRQLLRFWESTHSYSWRFVNVPEGSNLNALAESHTCNPTFVPDQPGEYVLEFEYSVGGQTAKDTVTVVATTENLLPVVMAGDPHEVVLEEAAKEGVGLNGSGSFDPNDDKLTFRWSFSRLPTGSRLQNTDITGATFATETSKLTGAAYYNFFALLMFIASVLFIPVAMRYKAKKYIQGDEASAGH